MTTPASGSRRLPRALHPMAWWLWALSLAALVTRTTNPLLLLLVLAVVGFVVASRRSDAPWATALRYYFVLALVVIVVRVVFRTVFGGVAGPGDHVLVTLPRLPLPGWAAGVSLGGPVSVEGTVAAAVDGLRLGCLLCCIGAANVLANPRRALRVLPAALYELGVAVVVCVSVAPQLIESTQRVRRARRLRGGARRGWRAVGAVAVPVLEDALDRSLSLAAAMDSRGYGRSGGASLRTRRLTFGLLLTGMVGLCGGCYGLLDPTAGPLFGLPMVLVGAATCIAGLLLGGRRVARTRYRPDPWRGAEWVVAGCGVLAAGLAFLADGGGLEPSLYPLAWPPLPVVPVVAILLAAVAGVAAPPPVRSVARPPRRAEPIVPPALEAAA